MINPHEQTAVTLDNDEFYKELDRVRRANHHTWPDVTLITGVGINVFRRLREGAETRLPAYLSLALYCNTYGENTDEPVPVDLPGAVGELYDEPDDTRRKRQDATATPAPVEAATV